MINEQKAKAYAAENINGMQFPNAHLYISYRDLALVVGNSHIFQIGDSG
jgi:hypothetical protein